MKCTALGDLQASLDDKTGFRHLSDYLKFGRAFLAMLEQDKPTRIVSPSHSHYVFYQYSKEHGHAITRPLNTQLFYESQEELTAAFARFADFLERKGKSSGQENS